MTQVVYFVGAEALGRVKIGISGNPARRMGKIATDAPCPVALLAIEPGGRARECALHAQFASDRVTGEWFALSDPIRAYIAALPPVAAAAKVKKFRPNDLSAATGWSQSHCSRLLTGTSPINLERAMFIYARTGLKLGPIAEATEDEVAVLVKYVSLHGFDSQDAKAAAPTIACRRAA